jgi:PAS domain S-box-containing protein
VNFSELIAQAVLLTRSDAIIAADRDGIIRFWNPGAERIFGHVSGEAIGSFARPHHSGTVTAATLGWFSPHHGNRP